MDKETFDKVIADIERVEEEKNPELKYQRLYGTTKKGIELDGKYYVIEANKEEVIFIRHYIKDDIHYTEFSGCIDRKDLIDILFKDKEL